MTTIMEETDSPLTSRTDVCVDSCKPLEFKPKCAKDANSTLNSSKNAQTLTNESKGSTDTINMMNDTESAPMGMSELSQERSRRSALVKDSDSDPAILLDTDHVQNRGRRRALVKDPDSDTAILFDDDFMPKRSRSRRGAVIKKATSFLNNNQSNNNNDDSEEAILLPTEHVQDNNEQKLVLPEEIKRPTSPRSKSFPNFDLSSSLSSPPHRPLSRTISMDSLALSEWVTSLQSYIPAEKQNISLPELPKQPSLIKDEIKSHRRNSSLPNYVQRLLPELTGATSRPKSPLVLHELRSSAEPDLTRQSSVQPQEDEGLLLNVSVDSATFQK